MEDALCAARHGADAVGLVFHPASRRAVGAEAAAEIARALPPFVTAVALFVDPEPEAVEAVLARVPVGLLQFHGAEPPELCRRFGLPYLKAVPMGEGADPRAYARRYPDAAGLLLDSHGGGRTGGSGEAFDWGRVPGDVGLPVVLAGGLHPGNVAEAVRRVRPWAVDVSSGVESAPGLKDPERIEAFMREVRRGEHP